MTPEKKWVVAREQKVETSSAEKENNEKEENELETVENPESIIEQVKETPNSLMNTDMGFRPFTPPFAQFQSSPSKLKKSMQKIEVTKESTKASIGTEGGRDTQGVEFGGINEVFGEDEEKIDVVYDPILKCYYDPNTGNYYQLSN